MALSIEVVNPTELVWQGRAQQASVPLIDGEAGILPGRQPLLALLGSGALRLTEMDGTVLELQVRGGFCSVDHDTVTIAADEARLSAEA
ncbi:ATP synthase subunit epsilon [Actinomyces slackii]|uniref:F-ATPase epsilon subunit n=1 Tax=Actinomyces slackii TaxID=52774 RepID=A0A448KC82_9ACTO|nr:ATP synthase subunit epsilon [Actinomyces slackii]VEG74535.1 F-ATPase epsilon subunit [Actinomyces slackii]